ncbi:MAG: hypothetical protein ACPHY8_05765 [Patescibacteria group bacterium]
MRFSPEIFTSTQSFSSQSYQIELILYCIISSSYTSCAKTSQKEKIAKNDKQTLVIIFIIIF